MQRVVEQLKQQKEWEEMMKLDAQLHDEDVNGLVEDDEYAAHVSTSTSLWIYLYRWVLIL